MRARQLIRVVPGTNTGREVFGCNGEWRLEAPDNTVIRGGYTTDSGHLCVMREDGSHSCRTFDRAETHRVFFRDEGESEPAAYVWAARADMPECGPVQLYGNELREAIRGQHVDYPDPPEDGAGGAGYRCDGTWISSGRFVITGRYQILRDRVCVFHQRSSEYGCNTVFRDSQRRFYSGEAPHPPDEALRDLHLSTQPSPCD